MMRPRLHALVCAAALGWGACERTTGPSSIGALGGSPGNSTYGSEHELSGRATLPSRLQEAWGYGLYSYVLLGSRPAAGDERERALETIRAYLDFNPRIEEYEAQKIQRGSLNIVYLPVVESPSGPLGDSPDWLLDKYDYARGRSYLHTLGFNGLRDLRLVGVERPLSSYSGRPNQLLCFDLSDVPLSVIRAWVRAFMQRSSRPRFWDNKPQWMLETRTELARTTESLVNVASALPLLKTALADW